MVSYFLHYIKLFAYIMKILLMPNNNIDSIDIITINNGPIEY